jgi:hypothetical protein
MSASEGLLWCVIMQFSRYVPMFRRNFCLYLQGRIKSVCPLNIYSCCPFHKQSKGKSIVGALILTDTTKAHETRKRYPAAVSQEELQNYFRHFPTTSAARLAICDHWLFLTKGCEKLNAFSLRGMQSITMTSCQSDWCSVTPNTPRILWASLPYSQHPTTGTLAKPDESNSYSHLILFFKEPV